MSKKSRKLRQKIAKGLVSFLVLAAFFVPAALSFRWLVSIFYHSDPRKVVPITQMVTRPADKTTQPIKPFSEPLITVSFDDGWESVYTQGLPILQEDGIHTTQYIITDSFSNHSYMSLPQLQSLQHAGHDIASHTVTHPDLTTLDDTQLNEELSQSKATLTKDFGPPLDFTSPYGAFNAHTLAVIGQYYRSQKNDEGDPAASELEAINVKATFNPLNFNSYSIRKGTSLNDIKKLVAAAQQNNGWLVLTYHQIDNSDQEFSITPAQFKQQMDYLRSLPIRSATVDQVMNSLGVKVKGKSS